MSNVGERILQLRKAKNMGQEEFAEFCGLSRPSIARYESGKDISRSSAQKIAAACGISISSLLEKYSEENGKLAHYVCELSADELNFISRYRAATPEAKRISVAVLTASVENAGNSSAVQE